MGHPDGELCLARGAARRNIPYCVSAYSSTASHELAGCFATEGKGGALVFQLYVPKVKEDAKKLIAEAGSLGCTALVVTVDTAVVGKRGEDERYKAEIEYKERREEVMREDDPDQDKEQPIRRGHHSSTLDWSDLTWIKIEWAKNWTHHS